jgi:hypothetical protein
MAERIVFDRSLYLPEAVAAAADAYGELARIEVSSADDAVAVVISEVVDHEESVLARAFANHVLHETISRLRQTVMQGIG